MAEKILYKISNTGKPNRYQSFSIFFSLFKFSAMLGSVLSEICDDSLDFYYRSSFESQLHMNKSLSTSSNLYSSEALVFQNNNSRHLDIYNQVPQNIPLVICHICRNKYSKIFHSSSLNTYKFPSYSDICNK